jgi:hypothetical protein
MAKYLQAYSSHILESGFVCLKQIKVLLLINSLGSKPVIIVLVKRFQIKLWLDRNGLFN